MKTMVHWDENLYRVIKRSRPDSLNENGCPTSALFKQENGVSVDRDGGRNEKVIIKTFSQRFTKRFKGVVRIHAKICIENNIAVIPNPTENIFHAEIFENNNKEPLSLLKALILADNAKLVFIDPQIKWSKI